MNRYKRNCVLDISDYSGNILCQLYDNSVQIDGQAANVYVTTERNGWRELSFTLPCKTTDGERNWRLAFLKADYRIRLIDDDGTDWFLISQPKIQHSAFNSDVQVTAGHIAQLLKYKNLGLQFSDDEGNNVGTAKMLVETILEGTGWTYDDTSDTFCEDDSDEEKYRSLSASAKTGAFKLISQACDLFEAKPIYNGETKKVKLVHMNPFSEPKDGGLPDVSKADTVLELRYSNNVKTLTRTLNTENIATKLYAYGSYGDKTNGYCGIDELTHKEYVYTLSSNLTDGQVYYFTNPEGVTTYYHFTASNMKSGDKLIFSTLDPASMSYIWNDTKQQAVFVKQNAEGSPLPYSKGETVQEQNMVSFLMDFDYYIDIGLMSETMLQTLAKYQRGIASKMIAANKAMEEVIKLTSSISESMGTVQFAKLKFISCNNDGQGSRIRYKLDVGNYKHGVIYRSDYTETNEKKQFGWTTCKGLKTNGDPMSTSCSFILCVHNTNPKTYTKLYIKQIESEDGTKYSTYWDSLSESYVPVQVTMDQNPLYITVYKSSSSGLITSFNNGDEFYIFRDCGNNGKFLSVQDEMISASQNLDEQTKRGEVSHPTYRVTNTSQLDNVQVNGYAWAWIYDEYAVYDSILYFWYKDYGDTHWCRVHRSYDEPSSPIIDSYWYQIKANKLYKRKDGEWKELDTKEQQKVGSYFGTVYSSNLRQDKVYKGYYSKYSYIVPSDETISAGNYYFDLGYDECVAFSTKNKSVAVINEDGNNTTVIKNIDVSSTGGKNRRIIYEDSSIKIVRVEIEAEEEKEIEEERISCKAMTLSDANRIAKDSYGDHVQQLGTINSDGVQKDSKDTYRTGGIVSIYENINYVFESSSFDITGYHCYDQNKNWLYEITIDIKSGETLKITKPSSIQGLVKGIRLITKSISETPDLADIKLIHTGSELIYSNQIYNKLSPLSTSEDDKRSLLKYLNAFIRDSDLCYAQDGAYDVYKTASDAVTNMTNELSFTLGDMYREGYWQKNDYVDGDELKLYKDAIDNIKEVSKPKATYNISYIDLYGIQGNAYTEEEYNDVQWQDLSIMSAVHLIDEQINVNIWAYIDKISKCYDCPQKTTISINTDLSTISQKSFTDVMTNIAQVASELKGKQTLYDRSAAINGGGSFNAQLLEGTIDTLQTKISGAASTWYTDERGNIMFVNADETAAMKLSGDGFAISDQKDEWGDWVYRTFGTGHGFTADEIVAGYLSSDRIEAGTITTDHLSASVGNDLNISSNKAITLVSGEVNDIETGKINVGSLKTPTTETDTAYVSINKDVGVSLVGKSVNIGTYSGTKWNNAIKMDDSGVLIQSGADVDIKAGSQVKIEDGANSYVQLKDGDVNIVGQDINMTANTNGGSINLTGGNITMDAKGTSGGNISMTGGQIDLKTSTGDSTIKMSSNGIDIAGKNISIDGGQIDLKNGTSSVVKINSKGIDMTTNTGQINISSGTKGIIDLSSGGSIVANAGKFDTITVADKTIGINTFFMPVRNCFTVGVQQNKDNADALGIQKPFLWFNATLGTDVTQDTATSSTSISYTNYIGQGHLLGKKLLNAPGNYLQDGHAPYKYQVGFQINRQGGTGYSTRSYITQIDVYIYSSNASDATPIISFSRTVDLQFANWHSEQIKLEGQNIVNVFSKSNTTLYVDFKITGRDFDTMRILYSPFVITQKLTQSTQGKSINDVSIKWVIDETT